MRGPGFTVIDRNASQVEIGSWVPTVEEVRARQMPPTVVFIRVPEGKTVKNTTVGGRHHLPAAT